MSNFTMKPEEKKALGEFAGIVAEESAVVMSTLLDKKIDINVQSVSEVDQGNVGMEYPGEIVVVNSPFATGFDQTNYFLFHKQVVAKLSDLMMMGDGTAEFSEDHIDAIQEGVNQMMGAVATALSSRLNKTVDFQPSQAKLTALADSGIDLNTFTISNFLLLIEGKPEGKMALLVAYPVLQEMTSALSMEAAAVKEPEVTETGTVMEMPGLETRPAAEAERFAGISGAEAEALGKAVSWEMTRLGSKEQERLELLMDIKLDISIELGRTRMLVRDILELGPGSVVELDKMAGETVDLLINDKKLAEGEVVVVDENFGVRVTHLISMEERIKMLQTS
jgi:flagellar motor switch protein FliN/FliY